jgi:pilus assembly protein CpaB
MNFRNMGIAFAIALAVSGLCTFALGRKITANAAQRNMGAHYVVPAHALEANELLKAEDLTMVDWPSNDTVSGAFTKTQDVVGRTLLYPVDKGQPITDKLVSAQGAGVGLAGHIPDGMRAIALRSDEVMGVAGFLMPGTHVDVLATYRSDRSPDPLTVTVLQNAEVLAVGHQTQPDPDGKAAVVTVVTLLLKPEDAEKAVLASTQGTIHFVMRSGSDGHISSSNPVMLSELSNLPASTPQPAPTAPSATAEHHATHHSAMHVTPAVYSVQTIMGDKTFTSTFQVGQP